MAMSGKRHLTGINWLGRRVSSLLVEFSFLVPDVDKHDLFVFAKLSLSFKSSLA